MSVKTVLEDLGVQTGGAADGVMHTQLHLHTVGQLKALLDLGLSPQQRAQHADALLSGITAPEGAAGVELSHRLIHHVVGTGELSQDDHQQLAAALPVSVHVTTQLAAAVPAAQPSDAPPQPGDTGQPGGTPAPVAGPPMQVSTIWDVSTPDGSLRVIDLPNGLQLLDGGCIMARATPLQFSCTALTRVGAAPAGYADINILGAAGGPQPTPPAPPALAQAAPGSPGVCLSSGVSGPGGGVGTPGQQGTTGTPGVTGNHGIASALASFTITGTLILDQASAKALTIATQSGPGGPGGDGGPGGPGQQGGNGGSGMTCGCSGNAGGAAGTGGQGGTGGRAGDGGDGVDAAGNITVLLPVGVSTDLIQSAASPAPPGNPGTPGIPGSGGAPGSPGMGGKNNPSGSTAGPPPSGDPGAAGNPGSHTGTPAQITVIAATPPAA